MVFYLTLYHDARGNKIKILSKWVCPQNYILKLLPPPGLTFLSFPTKYKVQVQSDSQPVCPQNYIFKLLLP